MNLAYIIHLQQILYSQKTRVKIEAGNTIEYDVKSYQVNQTIVESANTKTATSFSFPELHANKLINQSLQVVDLNIDRYDMITGRDLIRSLGFDSHGTDMIIHWDNAAILWRNIDSIENDVFALSQHNTPFNSERKRMKRILDGNYPKANIKTIA